MPTDDVDRVRVRFVLSSYVSVLVYVSVFVAFAVLVRSYEVIPLGVITVVELWRVLFSQATSISFEPAGVELGFLFRKRRVRSPVTEFSGSRFRAVTVCDLHSGKRYHLTQWFGTRRLIRVAEGHGYPVLRRPDRIFQSADGPG